MVSRDVAPLAAARAPCKESALSPAPRGGGYQNVVRPAGGSRVHGSAVPASGSMSEDDGGGGALAGGKGAARMPARSAAVGGAGETPATPGVSLATAAAS